MSYWFWSSVTSQELSAGFSRRRDEVTAERIYRARAAAGLRNEGGSVFSQAFMELYRREQQRRDEKQSRFGGANAPRIPARMDSLPLRFKEEKSLNTWGLPLLMQKCRLWVPSE
jgi:hypothetical protein